MEIVHLLHLFCCFTATTPVGWNWTNSMSWLGSSALDSMPVPSPVHEWAEVHEKYARPYPLKVKRATKYTCITNMCTVYMYFNTCWNIIVSASLWTLLIESDKYKGNLAKITLAYSRIGLISERYTITISGEEVPQCFNDLRTYKWWLPFYTM